MIEAFLVKYDDIDGVYAGDDNMGVGALNAAKSGKSAGLDGIIRSCLADRQLGSVVGKQGILIAFALFMIVFTLAIRSS